MQKALEQMNLKLTEILSDITGVTGRAILRAILRGTRAPEKLAKYRDKGCKASEAEIAQALTGTYREEHLFELKLAYEAWQFTLGQVAKVDGQIALQLGRMKCDRALPPLKPKARPKRRVNSPGFDVRTALYYVVGLDLTEIEGISELTALTLISEIGPGVSRFATVKKFCSWLGLCPNWQKTGGRVKSSRTRRGVNRAAQALRLAAQSLHHSQGALGGFLRRMKGRLGTQAAVTATAHKLARIVYLALKHGMTYVRQSQEEYEAQMKEKQIKALRRKARQLGLEVIEKTSGSVPRQPQRRCRGKRVFRSGGPEGAGEEQGRHNGGRTGQPLAGEGAHRGEPGKDSPRCAEQAGRGEVPCNRSRQRRKPNCLRRVGPPRAGNLVLARRSRGPTRPTGRQLGADVEVTDARERLIISCRAAFRDVVVIANKMAARSTLCYRSAGDVYSLRTIHDVPLVRLPTLAHRS